MCGIVVCCVLMLLIDCVCLSDDWNILLLCVIDVLMWLLIDELRFDEID